MYRHDVVKYNLETEEWSTVAWEAVTCRKDCLIYPGRLDPTNSDGGDHMDMPEVLSFGLGTGRAEGYYYSASGSTQAFPNMNLDQGEMSKDLRCTLWRLRGVFASLYVL